MAKKEEHKEDKAGLVSAGFPATKTQIEAWRKAHGEVIEVSVFLDKEKKNKVRCFLKDPYENISVLSAISTMNDTPLERNNYIIDNLWIDGDQEFKTNTKVRLSGGIQAFHSIEILAGEVKKH